MSDDDLLAKIAAIARGDFEAALKEDDLSALLRAWDGACERVRIQFVNARLPELGDALTAAFVDMNGPLQEVPGAVVMTIDWPGHER